MSSSEGCEKTFELEPDLFGIGARTAFVVAAYCPVLLWWTYEQSPDTITAHLVALSYIIACAAKYSMNELHPINTLIALNIASLWFAAGQPRVAVANRKFFYQLPRSIIWIVYNAVKVWVWAIMPQELRQSGCTDLVYLKTPWFSLTLAGGYRILQIALACYPIAGTILKLVEIKFHETGEKKDLVMIPHRFSGMFGPPQDRNECRFLRPFGLKKRLGDGKVDNWTVGQVFALAAALGTTLGTLFNSISKHLDEIRRRRTLAQKVVDMFMLRRAGDRPVPDVDIVVDATDSARPDSSSGQTTLRRDSIHGDVDPE
ncbi:hypothetical protein BJ742DRAFT_94380 [Cladochytrium replicatum]|nr:hypothetical protein BJ742DRAFT_94380 [Cladochytrium replicatum]